MNNIGYVVTLLVTFGIVVESVYQYVDLLEEDANDFTFFHLGREPTYAHVYQLGLEICDKDAPFGSEYRGIQGALTYGCCAALFYLSTVLAHREILKGNVQKFTDVWDPYDKGFVYIETGSFLGLSSHVVAAGLRYAGSPGLIYCHDLWDDGTNVTSLADDGQSSIWDSDLLYDKGEVSRFARFYRNVVRENLQHFIIPIQGNSLQTLRIHPDESAHMIFVDGSHTYENVLADLGEAWRILKPGGVLLGHDCLPTSQEALTMEEADQTRGVRKAVKQFCAERGLTWQIVGLTMYMFIIEKPF